MSRTLYDVLALIAAVLVLCAMVSVMALILAF